MFNKNNFPFKAQVLPEPSINYASLAADEFLLLFYAGKIAISERDKLPAHIHYLIKKTESANLNNKAIIAALKYLYICLTYLHFHTGCHCEAFSGRIHSYYDHLFELFIICRMEWAFSELSGEHSLLNVLNSYALETNDILFSMGITLLPFLYLKERKVVACNVEKKYLSHLQDIILKKTLSLYVRYVAQEIYLHPKPNGPVLFSIYQKNPEIFLNDFDLRGSYFEKTTIARSIHADVLSMCSLKNADCRWTTWIDCDMRNLILDGADFSNAFCPSLSMQVGKSMHANLAVTPLKFPSDPRKSSCVLL